MPLDLHLDPVRAKPLSSDWRLRSGQPFQLRLAMVRQCRLQLAVVRHQQVWTEEILRHRRLELGGSLR